MARNNNKVKKGPKKNGGGRKAAGQRPRVRGERPSRRVGDIAALINPFNELPGKIPDVYSGRSTVYAARYAYNIAMGQDSVATTVYRGATLQAPRMLTACYKPTYTATNQLPITGWSADATGDLPSYATLSTTFDTFRLTSWGLRVYSVGPPVSSAGQVVLKATPQRVPTDDLGGPQGIAVYKREYSVHELAGEGIKILALPTDNGAFEFHDVGTTAPDVSVNWDTIQIHVEGNSSTQIRVEVFKNFELIPIGSSFAAQTATKAADYDTSSVEMMRNAYNYVPQSFKDSAMNVIGNAVRVAAQKFLQQGARTTMRNLGFSDQLRIEHLEL